MGALFGLTRAFVRESNGSVPNLRYADVGRAASNERLERGFLVFVVSMRLSVALMFATSLLALGACRSSNTSCGTSIEYGSIVTIKKSPSRLDVADVEKVVHSKLRLVRAPPFSLVGWIIFLPLSISGWGVF